MTTQPDEALPALGEPEVPPVPDSPPVTAPAEPEAVSPPEPEAEAGGEPEAEEEGEASATQPLPPEPGPQDESLAVTEGSSFTDTHAAEPESADLVQHASNASPTLPANAQAAAAVAHAGLDQVVTLAENDPEIVRLARAIQAHLARYIPASLMDAAVAEARNLFG